MRRQHSWILAWALLLALSLLVLGGQQAVTWREMSGELSGTKLTWSGEIRVVGNVTVPANATLKIAAGTVVMFMKKPHCPPWELIVLGTLHTESTTATQPIEFTSGATSKSPGDWRGITLRGSVKGGLLSNLEIEYADVGLAVHCNGIRIEDCTIQNCYGVKTADHPERNDVRTGLFLHGQNITVKKCTITSCTWGIHICKSTSVTVEACTISGNKRTCRGFDVPNGIHIFKSKDVTCKMSWIQDNMWGIEVGASTVTISDNRFIRNGFGIVIYWPDGTSSGTVTGNILTPAGDKNAYSGVPPSGGVPQPVSLKRLFKSPVGKGCCPKVNEETSPQAK